MSHDRSELHELAARVAHAMDSGEDVAALTALLHPDIEWDFSSNPTGGLVGVDAFADWVRSRRATGNQGPGSGTRHLVSSITSTESVEGVQMRSYFSLWRSDGGGPSIVAVGTYDDLWVPSDAGWRLRRRLITT